MCTTAMYYVDCQHESYGVMVMVDSNEECTTIVLEYGTKFSTLPMTLPGTKFS